MKNSITNINLSKIMITKGFGMNEKLFFNVINPENLNLFKTSNLIFENIDAQ